MLRYVIKRLGYAFLTILVLIIITFFMIHAAPGDPFANGKAMSEATKMALREQYGLNRSIPEQLLIYIGNIFRGNLGMSTKYARPVTKIIAESFPASFDLGIRSLLIAVIGGVLIGSYAALHRGKKGDTFAMGTAVIGVSIPSFIVAALLQYFVALKLNQLLGADKQIFPIAGWSSEMHKILPAIALSLGPLATISRLMRTSMLDVLHSDYIRTAKAKGLSARTILFKHALRNAIMPIITILGPLAATVLTGTFVVEQVFSIPGMGKYFVIAITENDVLLTAGTTVFYGVLLVLSTLIVDLLYGMLDPRIKISDTKE